MSAPVIMTMPFVGGRRALPTPARWARQVTEARAFVPAVPTVMVAALRRRDHRPDTDADPRMPVAATEPPVADEPGDTA